MPNCKGTRLVGRVKVFADNEGKIRALHFTEKCPGCSQCPPPPRLRMNMDVEDKAGAYAPADFVVIKKNNWISASTLFACAIIIAMVVAIAAVGN